MSSRASSRPRCGPSTHSVWIWQHQPHVLPEAPATIRPLPSRTKIPNSSSSPAPTAAMAAAASFSSSSARSRGSGDLRGRSRRRPDRRGDCGCQHRARRAVTAAITRGAWDLGEQHLAEAWAVARAGNLEDYPPTALLHAAAARIALHKANPPRAREQLTRAQRLRPALTYALPHLAVQARIELARCHLALFDFAAVRTLLREIEEILRRRPGLGVFVSQAKDLRAELSHAHGPSPLGASALTAAKLRLLPMLSTPPVAPPDRRGPVPVPQHHQVGNELDLPEAGGLFAQTSDHPGPEAGAAGGLTIVVSRHQGDGIRPAARWNGALGGERRADG